MAVGFKGLPYDEEKEPDVDEDEPDPAVLCVRVTAGAARGAVR
jgi:hypothetical protein